MAMTINTNAISLNAQRNLSGSQNALSTTMQRLSSGLRVNSAKDDAGGLGIADRMNAQAKGMNVAIRNANDGISLAQTAEGALGKMGDMLQRMRELAVQSRNATNSEDDRKNLQKEFGQLQSEIKRTIESTSFNSKNLFNSSSASTLSFQVGANTEAHDKIDVAAQGLAGAAGSITAAGSVASMTDAAVILATAFTTDDTGSTGGIAIGGWDASATMLSGTTADASAIGDEIDVALNVIDKALSVVSEERSKYGAVQNRFEAAIATLQVNSENTAAARGRIMDADFAQETANLSRSQILQQAGTAMLAQANQLPQQVLSLLR
ncbi:flagellin [Caldimonas tepidiphila]|uniref:flagellin N-terminal helical domain-containing protein n=1 Tax=Caldimonas tepidiphila TaxID=2315841 RepID=UPI000E5BA85A|nr:flagellin [Caldimonas tepidiphila]